MSTSSFWVWVAPFTTFTLWSLSRNCVLILKELRSLPPSSMCTLWTLPLNLSIPDVPFVVYYCHQLSSGAGFRPSLQPSWSPLIFPFLFAVEELYGTRYQSGSFFLSNVGSGFHCLRSFYFFHVQGPVESHAQIPRIFFVMIDGTANIKNRNSFTRGVEVHNLGLGSVHN